MIVLSPGNNKTVQIYTRDNTVESIFLEQETEMTAEKKTATVSASEVDGQLEFILPFDYQTERYYYLKIFTGQGGYELNRSKIYCTTQVDFEKYSVLSDFYITPDKGEQYYIVKGEKY